MQQLFLALRVDVGAGGVQHQGQIYIPFICYLLGGLCVILIATFKTSLQLTKAYGLAVVIDMLLTTHFATLVSSHWETAKSRKSSCYDRKPRVPVVRVYRFRHG